MQNQPLQDELADRIAQRTLSKRGASYAAEVRQLLDGGLEAMRACGTSGRPRVSDIVASSGLSNEAFYRHFPSKDALVAAILQDGAERLAGYLRHQMSKTSDPVAQVRCWVEGVLSQAADEEIAATTLAVLWNAGGIGRPLLSDETSMYEPLAELLREPLREMGHDRIDLEASFIAHAVVGLLAEYLRRGERPEPSEVDYVVGRSIGRARSGAPRRLPKSDPRRR